MNTSDQATIIRPIPPPRVRVAPIEAPPPPYDELPPRYSDVVEVEEEENECWFCDNHDGNFYTCFIRGENNDELIDLCENCYDENEENIVGSDDEEEEEEEQLCDKCEVPIPNDEDQNNGRIIGERDDMTLCIDCFQNTYEAQENLREYENVREYVVVLVEEDF
jgi:hypothetical protein